ncbi:polymer-forming cytoskeletal protein [Brucepastera parasyntrophica]|uniref:bactofilin family protein n=1 Tax=Brucepastera parasyntrophica TaxID=2880008 RepID=UPI00210B63A4|nr:polymer-forming cytoskeletal protein [Brucepastera parasyntrophica]ULQ59855.1 polymer-forming cytoskeletal protein [Brucepastera parasyntrophica]
MARYIEKEKVVTILGEKTNFRGTLKFSEEVQIAGKFEGNIQATGTLIIKKGASCEAQYINAASVYIYGTVKGNITAGDRVEMHTGSVVYGNVSASRLRIADGVSFEGSVEMLRANPDIDVFTTRSDVLKEQLRSGDS